jgi:argininosuccinate lyase
MPRLPEPQDPLFQRLNSSLAYDRRLWPQDIAGSHAHIRALRKLEVLDDEELRALHEEARALDLDALVHTPCFFDIHLRFLPPVH